jgi:hypothetical protein
MKAYSRLAMCLVVAACIFPSPAKAAITITGVTGPKYLISGAPLIASIDTVFKISFENKTSGTNLELCAGSITDFVNGVCTLPLSSSGGPGFQFLTIVDAKALSGKVLYVIRAVGTLSSSFVLTIE